jgi:ribosomal-protein-alanine N-acetyltransferase
MVAPPHEIVTPRLLLRKPMLADARDIFDGYARDPEVTRYLVWRPAGDLREVESFLEKTLADWERGSAFAWSILLREDLSVVGMIDARIDAYMVNIGYVVGRSHWNRGIATEAVTGVCRWADGEPDVFRVWAVCAVENPASARVLEKAGMTREGILRRWAVFPNIGGAPRDCYSYARVREPSQ